MSNGNLVVVADLSASWLKFVQQSLKNASYDIMTAQDPISLAEMLSQIEDRNLALIIIDLRILTSIANDQAVSILRNVNGDKRPTVVTFPTEPSLTTLDCIYDLGVWASGLKPYSVDELRLFVEQSILNFRIKKRILNNYAKLTAQKILIVDDNKEWLAKLSKYSFLAFGDSTLVDTASNYGDALAQINSHYYDLYTINLNLTSFERDQGGAVLINLIRSKKEQTSKFVPIIITSSIGRVLPRDIVDLYERNICDYFLVKDTFSPAAYIHLLQGLITLKVSNAGNESDIAHSSR